jgi:hypothetical protein
MTLPRIIDVSETSQKATSFLPFFKRAGRQPAVVEYVAAGSRFKVILPKEDKKLTLVLAGIRTSMHSSLARDDRGMVSLILLPILCLCGENRSPQDGPKPRRKV